MPTPDGMPPPFQPFRADPSKSDRENGLAFLEWISEGIYRAVAVGEANHRALRFVIQRQAAGVSRNGRRPRAPVASIQDVLYEAGRFAVQNREFLRGFLTNFFRP